METLKIILEFIGAAAVVMIIGGWLLFIAFYKTQVVDFIDQEQEEDHLTIDDLIN